MHSSPQVRAVILLTCTKCQGEGSYFDNEADLCNCPRCENGWEAAAAPVSVLLNIYRPTAVAADCYDELADHIRTQERTGHSILRHLSDDLPMPDLEKLRRPRPAL